MSVRTHSFHYTTLSPSWFSLKQSAWQNPNQERTGWRHLAFMQYPYAKLFKFSPQFCRQIPELHWALAADRSVYFWRLKQITVPSADISNDRYAVGKRQYQTIGSLYDQITWCKITHAGTQVAQWDFQNKGRSRWTGTSCFVLEVPLCNLRLSMCDFVPCDGIVLRAYSISSVNERR